MIVTVDQILAHMVGDYVLQSHWMATEKTKQSFAAAVHAITYTLPFLLLTQSPLALAVIVVTHFIIDRFRLARYVVWAKNGYFFTRSEPVSATGSPTDAPPFLAVWLLIIVDNLMHVAINGAALTWL